MSSLLVAQISLKIALSGSIGPKLSFLLPQLSRYLQSHYCVGTYLISTVFSDATDFLKSEQRFTAFFSWGYFERC